MNIVLLGVGIGLLTLIPPGPVSLTLVQVGTRHGRQSALRGALGVASGDVFLAVVSVVVVGAGAALSATAFSASQYVAAAILVVLGALLVARPSVADASIGRIRRPGRALFLLTSLAPSAIGSWIALLAAMPFADDRRQLALFAAGIVIASFLWHPTLGALAAAAGARLSEAGHNLLSQLGGIVMAVLGLTLIAQQLG